MVELSILFLLSVFAGAMFHQTFIDSTPNKPEFKLAPAIASFASFMLTIGLIIIDSPSTAVYIAIQVMVAGFCMVLGYFVRNAS